MAGSAAELMSTFIQDLRYAGRSFRGSPAFALAAIVTIGLGVGINTGIFSIVDAVVFGGVPAAEPENLVALNQDVRGVPRFANNYSPFTRNEYEAYRQQTETLSGVLAYGRMWSATLGGDAQRTIIATPVSCNYFDVLGMPPSIGGFFAEANCDGSAGAAVAVISHELWMDRFDGDLSVLGEEIMLNGNNFELIGVVPEGFVGIDLDRASAFVPIEARTLLRPDRPGFDDDTLSWLNLVGRLGPGNSVAQVEAEWNVIASQLDAGQEGRATTVSVAPARRLSSPVMRTVVLTVSVIVMAAFGLVLLVACVNVANLMLVRADVRARDIAIRSSLGATRGRLVRQLVTESLLIAVVGGCAGALLAIWAIDGLVIAGLSALPAEARLFFAIEPEPNIAVFGFALFLSMLSGISFGLVPALLATRSGLRATIEQDSAGAGSRTRGRLQRALVGVQVAFSMVLVIATALLLRGFYETPSVEPDFDQEGLIVVGADLESFGYDGARATDFQRRVIDEIRAMPGIDDAAQALVLPYEGRHRTYGWRLPGEAEDSAHVLESNTISANYFSVMDIPVVRGRAFTEAEVAAVESRVAILAESTARALWPNETAIGKTLISGFGLQVEIVGIARDVEVMIGEAGTPYIYLPAVEASQPELQLVIRSALPAASQVQAIRAIYQRLDTRLPVTVRTVDDIVGQWTGLSSVVVGIAFGLGALAIVLASVGVYGVMAIVVGRRVREIAIRLALGAGSAAVLKLVLEKSMRPVLIGAAFGILACFAVARLLPALLFGVGALDPVALGGAAVIVLGAGFVASALPARRALRVEPTTALRYE